MWRAALIVVVVIALFACFILGAWCGQRVAGRPVYEMDSELEERSTAMFADFQNKKVAERITLNVIGDCATEVEVVGKFDIGVAGFVRMSSPITQFYLVGKGFMVYRFNNEYLFVIIKDWYRNELMRGGLE